MYGDIQWFNFGALAGINAGDGVDHITIPGSLTPSIVDIEETSNVGIPGMWIFRFEKGKWMHIIKYVICHNSIVIRSLRTRMYLYTNC